MQETTFYEGEIYSILENRPAFAKNYFDELEKAR
jgi:hypothetical protein